MEVAPWPECLRTVVCGVVFHSPGSEPCHREEQTALAGEGALQTSSRPGVPSGKSQQLSLTRLHKETLRQAASLHMEDALLLILVFDTT